MYKFLFLIKDNENYEVKEHHEDTPDPFDELCEEVLEDPDFDPNDEYIEEQNYNNDEFIELQNVKKYDSTEHLNDENDNQKSLQYKCLKCDSSFAKKMQLNSHVASDHEGMVM